MYMTKVMIFGVFDGVHEGHRYFFQEAKKLGDYLVVVVAQDHVVEQLKKRATKASLVERAKGLEQERIIDEVVAGDDELGVWNVVKKYRPEIIALGYDQHGLKENLESLRNEFDWQFEIKTIDAYQSHKYHNALLNG